MIEYLKDKRFIFAGVAVIGSMFIYRMFRGNDTPKEIVMTAQGLSEGNLALIGKAQEFTLQNEQLKSAEKVALASLENDRYVTDAGLSMLKEQNNAYLTGLEVNNQFALSSQVNTSEYALMQAQEASVLSKYLSDSQERIAGAQLGLEHSKEGTIREKNALDYNAQINETNQNYNLQNYQTMVQHDLGKKGIKAKYYSGIIGNVTGLASKFLGG